MERRFLTAGSNMRLEARAEGELPKIIGYASVFYDGTAGTQYELWDDTFERIMPGAFDRALKEDDCRALVNHDANNLLGRTASGTLRLSIDKTGLRYEIDTPNTTLGRDTIENIRPRAASRSETCPAPALPSSPRRSSGASRTGSASARSMPSSCTTSGPWSTRPTRPAPPVSRRRQSR